MAKTGWIFHWKSMLGKLLSYQLTVQAFSCSSSYKAGVLAQSTPWTQLAHSVYIATITLALKGGSELSDNDSLSIVFTKPLYYVTALILRSLQSTGLNLRECSALVLHSLLICFFFHEMMQKFQNNYLILKNSLCTRIGPSWEPLQIQCRILPFNV